MGLFDSPFADPAIDVTPAQVAARIADDGLLIVDIREQYEWDAGHVPGAAHVEIERVASAARALPRDRPVAFMCRAGIRSGMVATAFRTAGYDAYSVEGGFTAWFAEGLPTEPDDAVVAPH